jgi:hypothetical protein
MTSPLSSPIVKNILVKPNWDAIAKEGLLKCLVHTFSQAHVNVWLVVHHPSFLVVIAATTSNQSPF